MNKVDFPVLAAQIKGGLTFPGGGNSSSASGLDFQETLAQFLMGTGNGNALTTSDLSEMVPQKATVARPRQTSSLSIIRPAELQMIRSERSMEKISAEKADATDQMVNDAGDEQGVSEKEEIQKWKDRIEKIIRESGLENPLFLLDQLRVDPEVGEVFQGMDEEAALKIIAQIQKELLASQETASVVPQRVLSAEELGDILADLRNDPKEGTFWKALDDETALALLSSLLSQALPQEVHLENPGETMPTSALGAITQGTSVEEAHDDTAGEETREKIKGRIYRGRQADAGEEAGDQTEVDTVPAANPNSAQEFRFEAMNRKARQAEGEGEAEMAADQQSSNGLASDQTVELGTFTVQPNKTMAASQVQGAAEGLVARIIRQEPIPGKPDARTLVLEPVMMQRGEKAGGMGGYQQGAGSQMSGDSRKSQGTQAGASVRYQDPVRATVFSEIVQKAHLLKGPQAEKVLTIQLKPEFLGKVHLELTSKDGGVTGRIVAENPTVREKMEEFIPQIKSHLSEQGIELRDLTVDVFARNPDEGKREGFSQSNHRRMDVTAAFGRGSSTARADEASGPVQYHDPLIQGIDIRI